MSEFLGRLKAAAASSLDWAKDTAQSGIKLAGETLGLTEKPKEEKKPEAKPETKLADAKAPDKAGAPNVPPAKAFTSDSTVAVVKTSPDNQTWASKAFTILNRVSDYVPTLAIAKAVVKTGAKIYEDAITGNKISIQEDKSLSINSYLASKGYSGAAAFLLSQTAASKVDTKPNKIFDLDAKCFSKALDEQAKIYETKVNEASKQGPNCSETLGKLNAEEWESVLKTINKAESELPKAAVQPDGSLDFAAFAKGAIEGLNEKNKTRVTDNGAVHVNAESKIVTIKEGSVVGFLRLKEDVQIVADTATGDRVAKVDGKEHAHRNPDGSIDVQLTNGGHVRKLANTLQFFDKFGKPEGKPISIGDPLGIIKEIKGSEYVARVLPETVEQWRSALHEGNHKTAGKDINIFRDGLSVFDSDGTKVFLKNNGEALMELPMGATLVRSALGKFYVIEKGKKELKRVTREELAAVEGEPRKQLLKALTMLEGLGDGASVLSLDNGVELSFVKGMVQALVPNKDGGERAKVTSGITPDVAAGDVTPVLPTIESQGVKETFDIKAMVSRIEGPKGVDTIDYKTGRVTTKEINLAPDNTITVLRTGDTIGPNGEVNLTDGTRLDTKGDVHFADGTMFHRDGTVTQNGKMLSSDGAREFAERQAQTVMSSAEAIAASVASKCYGNNVTLGDIAMIESGLGQVSALLNLLVAMGDTAAIAKLMSMQATLEGSLGNARASFASSTVLRAQRRDLVQQGDDRMIDPVRRFQARYTADQIHLPV